MTYKFKFLLPLAIAMATSLLGCKTDNTQAEAEQPVWLESDSTEAIQRRILSDFRLTRAEADSIIMERYPGVTHADIDTFIAKHYIEAKEIDGVQRIHRKSPGNLKLLNPEFNGGARIRGDHASQTRISYVDSVLNYYRGKNPKGLAHDVTFRFTIDVPYHEEIAGDTLRVWMPVPLQNPEGGRQNSVEIVSATPSEYILSDGKSMHNSIYFTAPAPTEPGDTVHFEYTGKFQTQGRYFALKDLIADAKPYDKESELYKRYTTPEGRHVIRLDSLAQSIVGKETNPAKQVEMVYDYIISRYPWAGAREYSTISCIPEYVMREGHGDCGQVSLLFISLMRSLGVPARWESGWMIHPGEVNLHDWAEVYYEGIGWVPVDVSFGRYATSSDPEVVSFYSHGIDAHRLAANTGVGGEFYPEKKFVRSETVDFQLGEVEVSKGNLFYPAWNLNMEVIEVQPAEPNK